jgi:hypothetical protein
MEKAPDRADYLGLSSRRHFRKGGTNRVYFRVPLIFPNKSISYLLIEF